MKGIQKSCDNPIQKPSIGTIFYLLCLGILFSIGCTRYQFISIGSNLNKNSNNEFVTEDDTLRVTYTFSGTDFPIRLTLFNKLQQPLYFDAHKSKVIMNNYVINDAFESYRLLYSIGAKSATTIACNNLSDKFVPLSHKDSKSTLVISTSQGNRFVKQHNFNEETSPVFFNTVLAFSTQRDQSDIFYYEHPFWVSGIYQTYDVVPYNMPNNQFSMQKTTGFASFMTYTGTTVLLLAALVVSASNPEEEE